MKRKVVAALILAIVAAVTVFAITRYSFSAMLGTVNQLSSPNEKILGLNRVFEEITTLDQQQRAEAIANPQRPYKYFLDQTGFLNLMIDSLVMLQWDTAQLQRLLAMKEILNKRNESFVAYMKVKAELSDNREFSSQLDTLAIMLRDAQQQHDRNVLTIREEVTKTLVPDTLTKETKDTRTFLKKLFGKKRKQAQTSGNNSAVKEQTSVRVDTVNLAADAIDYEQFHRVMAELESDQRSQRKRLQNRELELIHTNNLFINQLLKTLHEVQKEELAKINASNERAANVVDKGIARMNILLVSFVTGIAILIYFVLIDVSKSKLYRHQLEKAKNRAEELSQIKQRFLANMSHEIRTPLQSIIGFSEQLGAQQPNDEAVKAIQSSSEHLLHIVNEVLDYSRISSGRFTLDKEPVNLEILLKEIEAAMKVQAQRKGLHFILQHDLPAQTLIHADPFRLRQILYNLLGNAIKFTTSGTITLEVQGSTKENTLDCEFTVTDSGIGMTKAELDRIFNQFEQANPQITKTFGGTGLGLAIVKSLIDAHGGTIQVKSEPGHGTSFNFYLSFEKTTERGQSKKVELPVTPPVRKVMVVDDDAMILKLCSLMLKKRKIEHFTFSNPVSAQTFIDNEISHVFIDMRMPQMSGLELLGLIKSNFRKDTFFTALTAHVLPDERARLLEGGFDFVLPKPFHESQFIGLLGATGLSHSPEHDFGELRKMTMGDEALFQSIIQQFIEETDDDLGYLKESVLASDAGQARELIHKLAGRTGQMGLYNLSAQWHELELRLVAGETLQVIGSELSSVMKETDELLNQLRPAEA